MLFSAWRTLVKIAYQGGEPTHAALIRAVADGARAITVRDVESDLALSRSYETRFATAKIRMAGTRLTDDIVDVIAEVRQLMPIDDDTEAITAIIDNAISSAYDDVNGIADKFDAYLLQAAIDLQRHVPFYHVRQMTTYLADSEGVVTEGFVSRIPFPTNGRIQQFTYGRYYAALEADVEFEADDVVISNGRAYKVVTGGTLTVYEIGAGLTSTNGDDETLGDLVFRYFRPERDWPVRKFPWESRNILFAGDASIGPLYTMPEECDQIWLFPALDDENRFDLEWVGIAEEFADDDEVTFDKTAAEAAAHYIRAMLYQTEMDDTKQAAPSLALYQRAVRKAIVDNQARDTGAPTSVALYDWRRRWRCCGVSGVVTENSNNQGTETTNSNSENDQDNAGGVAFVTPGAPNHIERISFTTSATPRDVVLHITRLSGLRCAVGDVISVIATFEAAAVELTFLNSTQSGDEITSFSSEYAGQQARLQFSFNGTTWNFLPP